MDLLGLTQQGAFDGPMSCLGYDLSIQASLAWGWGGG